MWRLKFYSIINEVDNYITKSDTDFYQHVETLYKEILSLQLELVDINREEGKYSQSHLITFALAAYCDERLNIKAISSGYCYEMLQTQLFKTLEAGKVYYQYLEYLVAQRSQIYIDTYWVYYYLLTHGYKGMYDSDNYFERSLYLRQLKILLIDYTPLKLSIESPSIIKRIKDKLKRISLRVLGLVEVASFFCLICSYFIINYL
ncbi:DotU family type IV/VI secretion system protein [Francisella sp. 19X1-34]|uniref:DotU family type IV/VI secretion system protein n=1 Tax=Francisella sp. 19X1-34 TaxID=3087177 RepID=UPI002E362BD4|nr:DotU family type IV/VI secretion system protein [Francisella sp. 19X1-34]MED7788107.1 DotU family type IV/VI secretion system protein [Francisella sp. 19X1-34]